MRRKRRKTAPLARLVAAFLGHFAPRPAMNSRSCFTVHFSTSPAGTSHAWLDQAEQSDASSTVWETCSEQPKCVACDFETSKSDVHIRRRAVVEWRRKNICRADALHTQLRKAIVIQIEAVTQWSIQPLSDLCFLR